MAKQIPKRTQKEKADGWSSADVAEEVYNHIAQITLGDRYITEFEQVDDVIAALLELGYLERSS